MFDHTEKVRQHDLFRAVPSKPLKDNGKEGQEGQEDHVRAFRKPSEVEIDSLFLRVDSRKELEEEDRKQCASHAVLKDVAASFPSPEDEASDEENDQPNVVDLLLAKYTTFFDEVQSDSAKPAWIRL